MLDPEYLDHIPDNVVNLYADLEMRIIEDMARRISKTGSLTDTARWQLWKLEQIGAEKEFIEQHLRDITGKTQNEIISLLRDAGEEALAYDDAIYRAAGLSPVALADNPALQQVIMAGLKKTNRLFENLTGTIANTATKQFENVLDGAYMDMMSGAFSYQEAIKGAVKTLSRSGIDAITYPSGHVDKMDVAVRRAVLTGVNQTAAQVQLARADEMGCDLVETTAHGGARPSHAEWQGKVFSRSGRSRKYPDFYRSTGYGTGPGLCGWNCRHSFYPFFEGLSEAAYSKHDLSRMNYATVRYNGKDIPLYEAQQHQRYQERQIRRWKREQAGLDAAGLDSSAARQKVREWQAQQRDFIRQTGLPRDYFRERAGKQLTSTSVSGILTNKDKYAINNYISAKSYSINYKLRYGIPLDKEDRAFMDSLDSAIQNLPDYKGTVYRSISSDMLDEKSFWTKYTSGNEISEIPYTSAGVKVYDQGMDIQMVIQSKRGKDMRRFNPGESEVLFSRGTRFKVLRIDGNTIYMEEI